MFRLLTALALSIFPAVSLAGELVIDVGSIRSDLGQVRIALYDSAERFLTPDGPVAAITRPAVQGGLTVRFTGLATGDYAVALFHDENNNGELDSNLFGVPVEGTAFSRDGRGSFGPPDFAAVSIRIEAGAVQVTTAHLAY